MHELGGAPLAEDAVVRMVGEGAAVLVRRALIASGLIPDTPGALERFLAIYDTAACSIETVPYPGTFDILRAARGQLSAGRPDEQACAATARIVEALGLATLFDPVVGGDTPFGRKPDPAGLLHIVRGGDDAGVTTLVGDSPADLGRGA